MAYEWGRLTWWLAQGQNSAAAQLVAAVLLTGVTVWYAILTHWIMKATGKQASAALQPVLSICRFKESPEQPFPTLLIENPSDRPVVFLDVVISCYPHGHKSIVRELRGWDDQIISPSENKELRLDFTEQLSDIRVQHGMCGFGARIVVSDLSRQVGIQYEFLPVVGNFSCKTGLPLRVRWRYLLRPWGWRYHRIKGWFSKKWQS